MLSPRLIPCLLVNDGALVKTVRFEMPKYVGDPLNAVRIFNEKEVDELMVLDISATRGGRLPDLKLISELASECRMPLCYGGGVKTVEQAQAIIQLGVEKVAIGSAAAETPELIAQMARRMGSQSVVVVLDVKPASTPSGREVMIRNGTTRTARDLVDFACEVEGLGAGEIVLNSLDRDGTMAGYDINAAVKLRCAVSTPITILGGAGSHEDIASLLHHTGIVGAAAGSLFVFKGKYRAVLINYPRPSERRELMKAASGPSLSAR